GRLLPEHDKERFHEQAFAARRELAQFGVLAKEFIASKVAFGQFDDNARATLCDHLNKLYKDCQVESVIDEDQPDTYIRWRVSYFENAKKKAFDLKLTRLSPDVLEFTSSWADVSVGLHSKEYKVASVLEFNKVIDQ